MKIEGIHNEGMTIPELTLAVIMLAAFAGITVMVTQYTSRFFRPLNQKVIEDKSSQRELVDTLNDNNQINKAFDSIIEIFSEPGIDKNFILNLKCTSIPSMSTEWNIPVIDKNAIPRSYKICIKPTTLRESNYPELANGTGKPGIYILYSKPHKGVSINATPIRRIFCRPKPFCKL